MSSLAFLLAAAAFASSQIDQLERFAAALWIAGLFFLCLAVAALYRKTRSRHR